MSTNLVRMKFAAVAAKIEVAPGTDAIGGTPVWTADRGSNKTADRAPPRARRKAA